ncbi:unnamed protein product [Lathyrus sativus]|jgi:hypothetical protein
MLVM